MICYNRYCDYMCENQCNFADGNFKDCYWLIKEKEGFEQYKYNLLENQQPLIKVNQT